MLSLAAGWGVFLSIRVKCAWPNDGLGDGYTVIAAGVAVEFVEDDEGVSGFREFLLHFQRLIGVELCGEDVVWRTCCRWCGG